MQNRKALFLLNVPVRGLRGSVFPLFLAAWLFSGCAGKPAVSGGPVGWMSVEQAAARLEKEKRPVLIDLYTDWCGWCKVMDRKTYSNQQVAQYLQDKFYPVKLNAESRSTISWNNHAYVFDSDRGANAFALYLTHGRLEFPTTIVIPPGGTPQAIPGYLEPRELELLVRYFGEADYNKLSFEDFQKGFKATW